MVVLVPDAADAALDQLLAEIGELPQGLDTPLRARLLIADVLRALGLRLGLKREER